MGREFALLSTVPPYPSLNEEHQPGACHEEAGAGASRRRQHLLHRHAEHVREHAHVLLGPCADRYRATCSVMAPAASEPAGASYSSWRLSHTFAGVCG